MTTRDSAKQENDAGVWQRVDSVHIVQPIECHRAGASGNAPGCVNITKGFIFCSEIWNAGRYHRPAQCPPRAREVVGSIPSWAMPKTVKTVAISSLCGTPCLGLDLVGAAPQLPSASSGDGETNSKFSVCDNR